MEHSNTPIVRKRGKSAFNDRIRSLVFKLRRGGMDYLDISKVLYEREGVKLTRNDVTNVVRNELHNRRKELETDLPAVRQMEIERLDAMLPGYMSDATNPESKNYIAAGSQVLAIIRQRSDLLGLDLAIEEEIRQKVGAEAVQLLGTMLKVAFGHDPVKYAQACQTLKDWMLAGGYKAEAPQVVAPELPIDIKEVRLLQEKEESDTTPQKGT